MLRTLVASILCVGLDGKEEHILIEICQDMPGRSFGHFVPIFCKIIVLRTMWRRNGFRAFTFDINVNAGHDVLSECGFLCLVSLILRRAIPGAEFSGTPGNRDVFHVAYCCI